MTSIRAGRAAPIHRHHSLRRWLGALPMPLLAALTLILPLVGASIGIAVVMIAWLARDSGRFEQELIDIYGPDSPELTSPES
ncbi:hypothetical protein [Novosphingobium clariflavum]|uniref:Uncharacterized protein n=1 Tax=Novosphingobium clariflavum TaxID=2029884 RepID=A0ABV6S672_9SPHN|nr:hypothetical protein [Novosphingobium clariflavum]